MLDAELTYFTYIANLIPALSKRLAVEWGDRESGGERYERCFPIEAHRCKPCGIC
ncbi:MAG: hypothetical protein ACK4SY_06810 [Pyrobaculum sp.]